MMYAPFVPRREYVLELNRLLGSHVRLVKELDRALFFETPDFAFLADEVDVYRFGSTIYIIFYASREMLGESPNEGIRLITFSIPLITDLPPTYVVTDDLLETTLTLVSTDSYFNDKIEKAYLESTFLMYMDASLLQWYVRHALTSTSPITYRTFKSRTMRLIVPSNLVVEVSYTMPRTYVLPFFRHIIDFRYALSMMTAMCEEPVIGIAIDEAAIIDSECAEDILTNAKKYLKEFNKYAYKMILLDKQLKASP